MDHQTFWIMIADIICDIAMYGEQKLTIDQQNEIVLLYCENKVRRLMWDHHCSCEGRTLH